MSFYSKTTNLFPDWTVTVAFYTAVHILEAVVYIQKNFTIDGKPHIMQHCLKQPQVQKLKNASPHLVREILVEENFPQIKTNYSKLHSASRGARYFCYKHSKKSVDDYVLNDLKAIIDWSLPILGLTVSDFPFPP
jgi:hypothetical protein